jgi:hypothetical protein
MPTSAQVGEKVDQLVVYPREKTNGVVVLATVNGYDRYGYGQTRSLRVSREAGGKTTVEVGSGTQSPFVNPDRVGQPYGYEGNTKPAWIEVQIRNRRYSSNPKRANSHTFYVPDPNLLCRYWVGDVDADVVIHAAIEAKKEASLRQQLEAVRAELAKALKTAENDRVELCRVQQSWQTSTNRWANLVESLANRLKRRWFKWRRDEEVLREAEDKLEGLHKLLSGCCD